MRMGLTMGAKLNVGQESVLSAHKSACSLGSITKYVVSECRGALIHQ